MPELSYQAQALPWLQVQPDIQYVITLGAGIANPNRPGQLVGSAAVLVLRIVATSDPVREMTMLRRASHIQRRAVERDTGIYRDSPGLTGRAVWWKLDTTARMLYPPFT